MKKIIVFAIGGILLGCSNGKGNQAVTSADEKVPLSKLVHDANSCPQSIQGAWEEVAPKSQTKGLTKFVFQGTRLVEKADGFEIIGDGEVRYLGVNDSGAKTWYVGACKDGELVVKMYSAAADGKKAVFTEISNTIKNASLVKVYKFNDSELDPPEEYKRVNEQ